MAVGLVGTIGTVVQGTAGNAVSTLAFGASENRTAGNLLILFCSVTGTATLPTTPSGWAIAKQVAGTSTSTTIFFRVATGADSAPTIAGITSGVIAGQLAEYSGVVSGAVNQSGSATGTTSPQTATNAGADSVIASLFLAASADFRSTGRASNDTWTSNHVTSVTAAGNNNGVSSVNHYSFGYGTTNSITGADTAIITLSITTSITGIAVVDAIFKPGVGTFSVFVQAQADIKVTSNVFAQAQALVKAFVTGSTVSGLGAQVYTISNLQADDIILTAVGFPSGAGANAVTFSYNSTGARPSAVSTRTGATMVINVGSFWVPAGVTSVQILVTTNNAFTILMASAVFRAGASQTYLQDINNVVTNATTGTNPSIGSPIYVSNQSTQELYYGAVYEATVTPPTAGANYVVPATASIATGAVSVTTEYNEFVTSTQAINFTHASSVEWVGLGIPLIKATPTVTFAQAQVYIKARVNVFAQAQASIPNPPTKVFAQAAALIGGTFTSAIDTFTRSVTDGWGTTDTGAAWSVTQTAADFDVGGSAATLVDAANTTTFVIHKAYLPTVLLYNTEAQIDFTFPNLPSSGSYQLGLNTHIPSANSSSNQSSDALGVVMSLSSVGVLTSIAAVDGSGGAISNTANYIAGETWTFKAKWLSTLNGGTRRFSKFWKVGDAEPGYTLGTSTDFYHEPGHVGVTFGGGGSPAVTLTLDNYSVHEALFLGHGQAQAKINAFNVTGFAQAQADIKATSNVFAQSQADIKAISFGFAQALALIPPWKFAQAQAFISKSKGLGQAAALINGTPVGSDTFTRSVSGGLGTADTGGDWLYNAGGASYNVNGTEGTFQSSAVATVSQASLSTSLYSFGFEGQVDFKISAYPNSTARIVGLGAFGPGSVLFTGTTINAYAMVSTTNTGVASIRLGANNSSATTAIGITLSLNTYYTLKTRIIRNSFGTLTHWAKLWLRTDPEPDGWQVTTAALAVSVNPGPALLIFLSDPANSLVTFDNFNTYEVSTAQHGQAQATINNNIQYFSNTSQDDLNASINYKMLTSPLGASTTLVTNTQAGTVPNGVTTTLTAGGTLVDFFTRPLNGFVMSGPIRVNVWSQESNALANAKVRILIEHTNGAGTFIDGVLAAAAVWNPEMDTTTTVAEYNGTATTRTFVDGDRIRIRLQATDNGTMAAGHTFTYTIGAAAGATGDSWVNFPVAFTERFLAGYAQAQADIKVTTKVFAQAQAAILAKSNAFAQAQANIKQTYNAFAQAQATIFATVSTTVYAQTQADIKQTYQGYAQAQADILATSNGFAQAQSNIKQTYQGYAQSQADIKQTYNAFAQAQSDIKATSNGFGQSQADIKVTSSVCAQAQADIKQTYNVFAQAQADIKQTYQSYAQAQADILTTNNVCAQAQADIKATSNGYGQSQADIKATSNGYGQAQGDIKQTYQGYAQAQADILATSQGYANAQADILVTTNQFAQAQTRILTTYNQWAQANADIKATNQGYAQAQGKINAFGVQAYGQALGNIAGTTFPSGQAQAKINAFNVTGCGQSQAEIKQTYNAFGQAQSDIKATSNGFGQSQADIRATYQGYSQANADIKATSQGYGQAQANTVSAINSYGQAQGTIKVIVTSCGQAQADIKTTYQSYGQAQSDIKVTATVYAQSNALIVTRVKTYAQAQASIKATSNASGNAQADVQATYNASGQAQGDVKAVGYGFAQAQAYVRLIQQGYAQAQATIRGNAFGQAQADILATSTKSANAQGTIKVSVNVSAQAQGQVSTNYYGFATAQATILNFSVQFAQAQAQIVRSQAFGQAQSLILQRHVLKNLTISDSRLVTSMVTDEFDTDLILTDTEVTVFVSDMKAIILALSDEADDDIMLSDIQH